MSITYQLTTHCRMTCRHCPYANGQMKSIELALPDIRSGELYMLTGGEPFEEVECLFEVISRIRQSQSYYRIATGGYIDIRAFYQTFESDKSCLGLNFGTDVLLRTEDEAAKRFWWQNWEHYRHLSGIAVTLTVDAEMSWSMVVAFLSQFDARQFLINNDQNSGLPDFNGFLQYLRQIFPESTFYKGVS